MMARLLQLMLFSDLGGKQERWSADSKEFRPLVWLLELLFKLLFNVLDPLAPRQYTVTVISQLFNALVGARLTNDWFRYHQQYNLGIETSYNLIHGFSFAG